MFDPVALRGVYANPPALALWGADSLEELLARDFSGLSPAVRARTDRLRDATADGQELSERWTFYPNGQPVTVQATISTYLMADGRSVLLFEAAPADVEAEERRAVEALRHTTALIALFDGEARPLFANPAAYATYGDGAGFIDRFALAEDGADLLAKARAGEAAARLCRVETLAGPRWHHMDARSFLDPVTGAAGVLLNERDVTARVEAENARAAAEQQAAMAETRQRFLTDMSHELRTPLNAVLGFSGLLMDEDLPAGARDHALRIRQGGERLFQVVTRMIGETEGGDTDAVVEAVQGLVDTEGASAETSSDRALRVLYVDDNDSNRALITAILSAQGIECRTADDGAQGLADAASGDWDVVLMDIQMPIMNGVESSRRIRALPKPASDVPIVAVTANALAEQVVTYVDAGMDDLVVKPIDMAELVSKVLHWGHVGRPAIVDPGVIAA